MSPTPIGLRHAPQRKQPLHPSNKNIKDFFKPFTIPRNRRPANDTEEDEIVVASSPSKGRRDDDDDGSEKMGGRKLKAGAELSAKQRRARVKEERSERRVQREGRDAATSIRAEQSQAEGVVESSALSSVPSDLSPLPKREAPRKQEEESSSALSSLSSHISPPKRREASRGQAEASSSALSSLPSDLSPYKPVNTPRAASKRRASVTPQGKAAALKSELPILGSPSSAAAKRRVLAAVVIPSSSPRPEAASPTPTPLPIIDGTQEGIRNKPFEPAHPTTATFPVAATSTQQQQHQQQLSASFSSTATTSSSRRIRKNGIQGVTNSDSDSGASSSDDELAEASTFVPRKRLKLTPEHPVAPVLPSGKDRENAIEIASGGERDGRRRSSRRAVEGRSKAGGDRLPSSLAETKKKPKLKHSLAALVRQQQREEQSETRLRTLQADFEAEQLRRATERSGDAAAVGLPSLGTTASDGEDGERMKLAIQRTEAGEGEEMFFYFRGLRDGVRDEALSVLPKAGLSASLARLADESWRTQAFLSGFIRDIAMRKRLPRTLRRWIVMQLALETRQDICEAYLAVLEACSIGAEIENAPGSLASRRDMEEEVWNLGDFYGLATPSAQAFVRAPTERTLLGQETIPDPTSRLRYILPLIQHSTILGDKLITTLHELIFAKLDARISVSASLKGLIDDTIETLLHPRGASAIEGATLAAIREQELQRDLQETILFSALGESIQGTNLSLQLRSRAVAAIPVFSERSHKMRRFLALELLIHRNGSEDKKPPKDESNPYLRPPPALPLHRYDNSKALLQALHHSPMFIINDETDFITLNHAVSILDIALDSGFHSPHVLNELEIVQKQDDSQAWHDSETLQNGLVDAFITRIASIAAQIKDAGTTHLSRTLAKSALERLSKRLEYCVRSKPRKRIGRGFLGFGVKIDGGDEARVENSFLRHWVHEGAKRTTKAV